MNEPTQPKKPVAAVQEKTAAQRAEDEAKTSAGAKPKFESCLIGPGSDLIEMTIGDGTFRLRSITAGESREILANTRLVNPTATGPWIHPEPDENGVYPAPYRELRETDKRDYNAMAILTVAAALGAKKQFGKEGWSYPDPITIENVERLDFEVILELYAAHQEKFRRGRFGAD